MPCSSPTTLIVTLLIMHCWGGLNTLAYVFCENVLPWFSVRWVLRYSCLILFYTQEYLYWGCAEGWSPTPPPSGLDFYWDIYHCWFYMSLPQVSLRSVVMTVFCRACIVYKRLFFVFPHPQVSAHRLATLFPYLGSYVQNITPPVSHSSKSQRRKLAFAP